MIHSHLLALVLGVVLSPIAPSTVAHSTPLLQGSPHIQAPAHVESPAAEKTVWTLDVHEPHIPKDLQPTAWGGAFHLARISFGDDGTCTASEQVERACGLLQDARKNNPNGVVALTFIHGWHHGGTWQDTHFAAFREILRKLSIREIERLKPRTVVGVYFAWNGDVQDPHLLQRGWLKDTTFSNRYKTAEGVGSGIDCRDSMRRLIDAAKSSVPQSSRAQLVMMGHSMGALVLESAFLSMLTDKSSPLGAAIADTSPQAVQTFEGSKPIVFPDLLLAINSAANSEIAKEIKAQLASRLIRKEASSGPFLYSPPILISVTASEDAATRIAWRIATLGDKTDGHDASLFTHSFTTKDEPCNCQAMDRVDLGQSWHCLRPPEPPRVASPSFKIDLPARERNGVGDKSPGHLRYCLEPKSHLVSNPVWVFQVPESICDGHNDIFNNRTSTTFLALMQISGAVVSLARDWTETFEPEK